MALTTGRFAHPGQHHLGWFRIFRGLRIVEIWFGDRWILIDW